MEQDDRHPDDIRKVREARLRRAAKRRGLTLKRSKRRDRTAVDYGLITVTRGDGMVVFSGTIDDAERWLAD